MRTKLIAFLAVIILIAAASAVFAEVLLTDNFNITGADTTDLMTDLAIRQSGTLATKPVGLGYAYGGPETVKLLSTGVLDINSGVSLIYINNDFFSSLSVGKILHYSVELNSINNWSTINIGRTGYGYGTLNSPSIAIEVAGGHVYVHSRTSSTDWKTIYNNGNGTTGWHKWDIYVTQASAAIKHVEVYLDGSATPYYFNDCDSAFLEWGSVNLQGNGQAKYDNVSVSLSEVPEPGSLLALMSGLIGISGLALRRRK